MKKKLTEEEVKKANLIVGCLNQIETLKELEAKIKNNINNSDLRCAKRLLENEKYIINVEKRKCFVANDEVGYLKCSEEIKKIKNKLKKINFFEEELKDTKKENNNKNREIIKNRKAFIIDTLLPFDFKDEEFEQYIKEENREKRLEILEKLQKKYEEYLKEAYRNKKTVFFRIYNIVARDYQFSANYKKNKKKFKNLLGQEEYLQLKEELNEVQMNYRKCKLFLLGLEKLNNIEKNNSKSRPIKKEIEENDVDYEEIIGKDFPMYQEYILRLRDIKYGKYIKEYGLELDKIMPEEINELFEKLKTLNEEKLLEVALLGRDVAKVKLGILRRGINEYDDVERRFLKKIIVMFESLIPEKEEVFHNDTSVYYEIIESLLDNDDNYSYIEKLLEEVDSFVDARKDKHILLLLVDKFIMNYKLELLDQGIEHINPEFYKEIMKLYLQKGCVLTEEEQREFNNRIEEFLEYCKEKNYKAINKVNEDILELREDEKKERNIDNNKDKEKKLKEDRKFISKYLLDEAVKSNVKNRCKFYGKSNNVETFMIKNKDNIAYSVEYSDDYDVIVGVHILDSSKLIEIDSDDAKNLAKGDRLTTKLDDKDVYPTISFTYRLLGDSNKIMRLSIDEGLIKVSQIIDGDSIENSDSLKGFEEVSKRFRNENNKMSKSYQVIENKVSRDLAEMFKESNIPFLYKKESDKSEDLRRNNHNAICHKLYRLPIEEAHKIFDVFDSVRDDYYMPVVSNEGVVELDSTTYLGYYLTYVINKIQSGNYDIDQEEKNVKEAVLKLNERKKYVPESIEKEIDRKIKRIVWKNKKNK